ncbi:MAG: acetyl-CoA decarbonylase/synthase complex subunit gamma [Methanomassiliicoccus sp.]|nr:acetyl-CoA decarbonylase/synthase complex subunit gamma [Methanomassiliicoccus sp.]
MPTAIEIFKFLPKKNCGKCNFPTCLAFAMQLANSKAKLDDCPFITDEARAKLEASSAPPIRLVTIGAGDSRIEIGDETELYRHDKKFFHQTRYAVTIPDTAGDREVAAKLRRAADLRFDRVGQMLALDLLAVRNDSKDAAKFAAMVKRVSGESRLPLVLMTDDPAAVRAAALTVNLSRPLIYAASEANWEAMSAAAKELKFPLAVRHADLNGLADIVEKVRAAGVEDLVLDLMPSDLQQVVERNTIVRKNAVKKSFRGLGFPLITNACGNGQALLIALVSTMKYGGIVLLDDLNPAHAIPLFVLRQNIYTDPQVPIQVKAGLYPINNPGRDAPILFTTNFSLTYFTVAADIEKSRVPAWLLVVDTEGLSVLTAFSAGKLTPESVAEALKSSGVLEKSGKEMIVIPGMLTRMSGKLQELSGLKVVVGPRESSGIPKLLRTL